MMRILLVEDEPSAMRSLIAVVEQKCHNCVIVDTAENGKDGLEKARLLLPDVVITDIKMPMMDGLSLASAIKDEFPEMHTIILSGVQEFSYAKRAITSGVVDYLLKPVNVAQLDALLETIRQKQERMIKSNQITLLTRLLAGETVTGQPLEWTLPASTFQLALVRRNGLPSRFTPDRVLSGAYPDIVQKALGQDMWMLPGRDAQERLFVRVTTIPTDRELVAMIKEQLDSMPCGYCTVMLLPHLIPPDLLKRNALRMQKELDAAIIPGLTQWRRTGEHTGKHLEHNPQESDVLRRLAHHAQQGQMEELKAELVRVFAGWEATSRPLVLLEADMRSMLMAVTKQGAWQMERSYESELVLDEMLYQAGSYGDLLSQLWDMMTLLLKRTEQLTVKADSPDFLKKIVWYLQHHLTEAVTLSSICQHFNISQTYISRLFRKHYRTSVIEYLNDLRMEKAKQVMRENPALPIKDVAALVGYADSLYFSRVFKSHAGMPPSEYTERHKLG